MKSLLLLFFSCVVLAAKSQDLTGTWEGVTGREYLKLGIIHRGDSIFGYSYDDDSRKGRVNSYCKTNFSGNYRKGKFKGSAKSFIDNVGGHYLIELNLTYSKEGSKEFLIGKETGANDLIKLLTLGIGSDVTLQRISATVDSTPYMKMRLARTIAPVKKNPEVQPSPVADTLKPIVKQQVQLLPVTEIKKMRISKLIQSIKTNSDSIRVLVYDNGEIDNDSVTVFFDDKVILENFRITDKAKEFILPISTNGNLHNIELFANNLGSIPPNTALVIIIAGKERYELRASYDLETNARINIQYSP